jgi:phenylalanyl-tRNA synthetase alpha chain
MDEEQERRKALIRHLFAQAEQNRATAAEDSDSGTREIGTFSLNPQSMLSPDILEGQLKSVLRQIGEKEGLGDPLPSVLSALKLGSPLHTLLEHYLQTHPMEELISQAKTELASVQKRSEWETTKSRFLGPNGHIRTLMKELPHIASDQRPAMGQRINAIKSAVETLFSEKLKIIEQEALRQQLPEPVDITLKSRQSANGSLHPITQLRHRLNDIFHRMGYSIAEGTEIETEWFCFDALNTPPHHPARNEQDTFYLPHDQPVGNVSRKDKERYILRSQTSTVQIRTMLSEHPPFRIVSPGRVFRRDTSDATHSANFHQYEGLYVDHQVSFVDLKHTLFFLLQEIFGHGIQMRLRPSFFPFTEPSFEVDIQSPSMGKLSHQWVEILGCGLVDPEVFRAVGYDPEEWSGFAFALGLERIAMFLYGIDDIRHFYRNDQRFLNQFT